jgi:hypothetical protein
MSEFWQYFNAIGPSLIQREISFRKTFEHLDQIRRPVVIVETGCVRSSNEKSLGFEGHSTLLFDKYILARGDGSKVFSVDINEQSVALCKTLVSNSVSVHAGDSVPYLYQLSRQLANANCNIDLLYLDSFDVDYEYWFASAAHHLKELLAAWRAVNPETLIVVDDCPTSANVIADQNGAFQFDRFFRPRVGGKGRLVAQFAEQVGAEQVFSHYQAGWKGFK